MGFFKKLVHLLRGGFIQKDSSTEKSATSIKQAPSLEEKDIASITPITPVRLPLLIQVGFDFGSSYCKCICRNIRTQKAWVFTAQQTADSELPFLLPSTLQVNNRSLYLAGPEYHYHEGSLPHVKIALVKCAMEQWKDPLLNSYREAFGDDNNKLKLFVSACAVYLLAGYLGNIRQDLKKRFPDLFDHPGDYLGINLAIPVADAELPEVNNLFHQVLEKALSLSDTLAGHPPVTLEELAQYSSQEAVTDGQCYIYPEVSANVQAFVRSSGAKPGIYFFSDTGAATVDQSAFILAQNPDEPKKLVYLAASVLPLGSSRIEQLAAEQSGNNTPEYLEQMRILKETQGNPVQLNPSMGVIGEDLRKKTVGTAFRARKHLFEPRQFLDMKIFFGGGGHRTIPYENYVKNAFEDPSLRVSGGFDDFLRNVNRPFRPPTIGMPIPNDLELENPDWMRRLWVAYGLSFYKSDLINSTYPCDDTIPTIIGPPVRDIPDAPGMEVT